MQAGSGQGPTFCIDKTKGAAISRNPLFYLVSREGIEPSTY